MYRENSATSPTQMYFTTLVLFVALMVIALVPAEPSEAQSTEQVALGAHFPGSSDPAKIDEFAQMVGKRPAMVLAWRDWANGGFNPTLMNAIASRGAMPVLTWQPHNWNDLESDGKTIKAYQPAYKLSAIAAGNHDPYVRQFARDARAWGKPFYLRLGHEMNGLNYSWGTQNGNANGNTPADYVAAWKHVHDIFEQEGVTNAVWVWNPDFTASDRPSYASLYPGGDYVDWVAIDAYNWGTSQSWSSWESFPQRFDASYKEMDALNDKPMMLGETASSEEGGDKAAWIRQTFLSDLPNLYSQVKAAIWFNENKETDWRVDSSQASLDAYKEVVASPLYQGSLPTAASYSLYHEAESFGSRTGKTSNVADATAIGGYHVNLLANSASGTRPSIQRTFDTTDSTNYVVVRAKVDLCGSALPNMRVYVDGAVIVDKAVNSKNFQTFRFPKALGSGSHTVKVAFTNDGGSCSPNRNLRVDSVELEE